jgi:hypothetical protein
MNITIPVRDDTGTLRLRTALMSGSYGNVEVEVCANVPDGSPIIQIGERTYLVSMHDIVKAVVVAADLDAEARG